VSLSNAAFAESGAWGDVPTWISSVAGLFALTFAAVAAVYARRTFQVESNRDRVGEEERRSRHEFDRRMQASLVSAWWGDRDNESGIYVRNASATPVYQAHIVAHKASDPYSGTKFDLPVVATSDKADFVAVGDLLDQRIVMTFTDSDGVRWRRDEYGRLHELAARLSFWGDSFLEKVLDQFKTDFLASYGVDVTFQTDRWRDRQDGFVNAAHAGNIADVLDAPHDWIGNLVRHDVIEPIVISARQRATFKSDAIEAMTYEGHLYGVPMNMFTTALIRNVDLVPDCPPTFDELLEVGLALRATGRVTHPLAVGVSPTGDPFKLSSIYTSLGGKVFARSHDGGWDLSRILVAEPDSIAALERIRSLGETGVDVLRTDIDEDEAMQLFCAGRAPFLIASSLAEPQASGIRCTVSPVPPFAGGLPVRPWSIATGLIVAKLGTNVAIGRDLVADYLARPDVVQTVMHLLRAPSPSRLVEPNDPALPAFDKAFAQAQMMPAHPDIAKVWSWLGELEARTIRGDDPIVTARTIAGRFANEFTR
jgi:arabinogalactan oligomer/maltooligosaccharide transport system substrate-binding protein